MCHAEREKVRMLPELLQSIEIAARFDEFEEILVVRSQGELS